MTDSYVHSGKWGAIYDATNSLQIGSCRDWSATVKSDVKSWVASNTYGATSRIAGNQDWNGSFKTYLATPAILNMMPGANFLFKGYVASPTDIGGANGPIYGSAVMVESTTVNWNWQSADPISHEVSFANNDSGGFQSFNPTGTSTIVPDVTAPIVASPIGLTHKYAAVGGSFNSFPNATSATLKVMTSNKDYLNSSTNGWKKRVMGIVDATYSITCQVDDFDPYTASSPFTGTGAWPVAMTPNTNYELKLYTGATIFWDIQWMMFHGFSNFRVDRESGAIVQVTLEFGLASYDLGTAAQGHIILPGATTWWSSSTAPFVG